MYAAEAGAIIKVQFGAIVLLSLVLLVIAALGVGVLLVNRRLRRTTSSLRRQIGNAMRERQDALMAAEADQKAKLEKIATLNQMLKDAQVETHRNRVLRKRTEAALTTAKEEIELLKAHIDARNA